MPLNCFRYDSRDVSTVLLDRLHCGSVQLWSVPRVLVSSLQSWEHRSWLGPAKMVLLTSLQAAQPSRDISHVPLIHSHACNYLRQLFPTTRIVRLYGGAEQRWNIHSLRKYSAEVMVIRNIINGIINLFFELHSALR